MWHYNATTKRLAQAFVVGVWNQWRYTHYLFYSSLFLKGQSNL
jgi:hypothetical protein